MNNAQSIRINMRTSGWMSFAQVMLVILGFFHAVAGLTALLHPDLYVIAESELLVFNFTIWGWAHLVFGALLIVAAAGLFADKTWAKVIALLLLVLSAIVNFSFMTAYPVWSVIMVAMDLLLIYVIASHQTRSA